MEYLKWNDFNPKNYEEIYKMFEPIFYKILPNNSKASFKYHSKKYNFLIITAFELKKTFSEELERFELYLIETYNINKQ